MEDVVVVVVVVVMREEGAKAVVPAARVARARAAEESFMVGVLIYSLDLILRIKKDANFGCVKYSEKRTSAAHRITEPPDE